MYTHTTISNWDLTAFIFCVQSKQLRCKQITFNKCLCIKATQRRNTRCLSQKGWFVILCGNTDSLPNVFPYFHIHKYMYVTTISLVREKMLTRTTQPYSYSNWCMYGRQWVYHTYVCIYIHWQVVAIALHSSYIHVAMVRACRPHLHQDNGTDGKPSFQREMWILLPPNVPTSWFG